MNKAIYEHCKFCKKECQENYIKEKLEKIKVNYPSFYEKVKNKGVFWIKN